MKYEIYQTSRLNTDKKKKNRCFAWENFDIAPDRKSCVKSIFTTHFELISSNIIFHLYINGYNLCSFQVFKKNKSDQLFWNSSHI